MALEKLDPKKTAIVLIEYQNEFTSEGGALYPAVKECIEKTNMLENSSKLMNSAREAGCSIVHVPISFAENHPEINGDYGILNAIHGGKTFPAGSWAAEFDEKMTPAAEDVVIRGKVGLCGFASTNLDFVLRQKKVESIVLGGFLTNCCIESTMRSAYELGYNVITLKDCTAATSIAAYDAAFEHNFGMFSKISDSGAVLEAMS